MNPDPPLWQEPNSGPFPENLSNLAEHRLWDGDKVPVPAELVEQMRAEMRAEPDRPPWWWRALWWPLTTFRSRTH